MKAAGRRTLDESWPNWRQQCESTLVAVTQISGADEQAVAGTGAQANLFPYQQPGEIFQSVTWMQLTKQDTAASREQQAKYACFGRGRCMTEALMKCFDPFCRGFRAHGGNVADTGVIAQQFEKLACHESIEGFDSSVANLHPFRMGARQDNRHLAGLPGVIGQSANDLCLFATHHVRHFT
ncbi:hypothetical protein DP49_5099 [Burkholderia pseudomallei]|nr:hypothetical protein DP49_5099 [Burkholderia pseudomallei]KGS74133.1 hypothetical protein X942_5536 [Burkholderia pseudomallei MSHR5596]